MLELKEITKEDEVLFCEFEKKYKAACGKEKIPFVLNPQNLTFSNFLKELEKYKHKDTLPEGFVLANYYLIYVDNRIVGGINLRMDTNESILNYAGHIGYGIAPWERNKGYAKTALKKILLLGLDVGMKDFLLTTDIQNIASQKVILSCGGILDRTFNKMNYYWIHLSDYKVEESAMALVFYNDKILTTKELIYGKEVISCPKGHIEVSEMPIDAAIRECFEETNIEITRKNYLLDAKPFVIQFIDHHYQPIKKTIYPICFKVMKQGNPKVKEERVQEIKYMDIEEFFINCSYENVKEMVKNSLEMIKTKGIK